MPEMKKWLAASEVSTRYISNTKRIISFRQKGKAKICVMATSDCTSVLPKMPGSLEEFSASCLASCCSKLSSSTKGCRSEGTVLVLLGMTACVDRVVDEVCVPVETVEETVAVLVAVGLVTEVDEVANAAVELEAGVDPVSEEDVVDVVVCVAVDDVSEVVSDEAALQEVAVVSVELVEVVASGGVSVLADKAVVVVGMAVVEVTVAVAAVADVVADVVVDAVADVVVEVVVDNVVADKVFVDDVVVDDVVVDVVVVDDVVADDVVADDDVVVVVVVVDDDDDDDDDDVVVVVVVEDTVLDLVVVAVELTLDVEVPLAPLSPTSVNPSPRVHSTLVKPIAAQKSLRQIFVRIQAACPCYRGRDDIKAPQLTCVEPRTAKQLPCSYILQEP